MGDMKFTALRNYAKVMVVFGWITIIGGGIVSLILYASNRLVQILSFPVIISILIGGLGLIACGQYFELQLAIHDELKEHTRLLKRLVNLNLPGKDE